MRCRHLLGLAVGMLAASLDPAARGRAQAPAHRVIVQVRAPHVAEAQLSDAIAIADQRSRTALAVQAATAGVRQGTIAGVRRFATLPYFAATVDGAGLSELARSPYVAAITDDVPRPIALAQSAPLVEAPLAWDAGYTGAGWAIAVLDTGVDDAHPFLSGRVVAEACYSTTDTTGATTSTSLCPGGVASTTSAGSGGPCSLAACDHGTHVAGIAAGRGATLSGVAPDAAIVAIQVFSRFTGSMCAGAAACVYAWDSDVIAGLDRVYALRDQLALAAVNLSLGSAAGYGGACDALSPPMTQAIDQLRQAGIATVVAAGNGQSTGALSFPACISSAVSVSSTTKSDVVSSFSNTALDLSLLAPGESITSAVPGGGFAAKMGTSMAAPHVAGAWAVLKERKASGTVDELLDALRVTGQPVLDSRAGSGLTFPRLRLNAALEALIVSQPAMCVDIPSAGTLPVPFRLAGWAVDRGAPAGAGVDAVHVWAYPIAGGGDFVPAAPS